MSARTEAAMQRRRIVRKVLIVLCTIVALPFVVLLMMAGMQAGRSR